MHDDLDRNTAAMAARLRQLPEEQTPPMNWQEFRRRSQAKRAPGHFLSRWLSAMRFQARWPHAAATAALLVVVVGLALLGRVGGIGLSRTHSGSGTEAFENEYAHESGADEVSGDETRGMTAGGSAAEPRLVVGRSKAIERWLASLPQEPAVVRVGTRAAVAGLEDQIAQVDEMLTSARVEGVESDRLVTLQRERARLVGSLAEVRYAEVVAAQSP